MAARKAVWICWEVQRRNRELADSLGASLHEMPAVAATQNAGLKYARGLLSTIAVLVRHRPRVVYCMNPSIVLATFLTALGRISPLKIVVDAHNAGLNPLEGRHAFLNTLARFTLRRADLTIVSNAGLSRVVEAAGGRSFVLPDRIPALGPAPASAGPQGQPRALFICTFAEDEPYRRIFDAALLIRPGLIIQVTGNYRKAGISPADMPENVVLLGFVPNDEYVRLLHEADITIDLTTREDCLVCGAYESMAAGKPMVLSSTAALREYFAEAGVYAEHTPTSLAAAIEEAVDRADEISALIPDLRKKRMQEWELCREALLNRVETL